MTTIPATSRSGASKSSYKLVKKGFDNPRYQQGGRRASRRLPFAQSSPTGRAPLGAATSGCLLFTFPQPSSTFTSFRKPMVMP